MTGEASKAMTRARPTPPTTGSLDRRSVKPKSPRGQEKNPAHAPAAERRHACRSSTRRQGAAEKPSQRCSSRRRSSQGSRASRQGKVAAASQQPPLLCASASPAKPAADSVFSCPELQPPAAAPSLAYSRRPELQPPAAAPSLAYSRRPELQPLGSCFRHCISC